MKKPLVSEKAVADAIATVSKFRSGLTTYREAEKAVKVISRYVSQQAAKTARRRRALREEN